MGRPLRRKMSVSCELNGEEQREILDAAMQAGHILLENGAEIFRVEETVDRICRYDGIESVSYTHLDVYKRQVWGN